MTDIPTVVWRDAEQRLRLMEEAKPTGIRIKPRPAPTRPVIYGPRGERLT